MLDKKRYMELLQTIDATCNLELLPDDAAFIDDFQLHINDVDPDFAAAYIEVELDGVIRRVPLDQIRRNPNTDTDLRRAICQAYGVWYYG